MIHFSFNCSDPFSFLLTAELCNKFFVITSNGNFNRGWRKGTVTWILLMIYGTLESMLSKFQIKFTKWMIQLTFDWILLLLFFPSILFIKLLYKGRSWDIGLNKYFLSFYWAFFLHEKLYCRRGTNSLYFV